MPPFAAMHGAQTWGVAARAAAGSTNSLAHSLFEAGKFGWGCTRRVWQCKPVEQTTSAASSAGPLRISGAARLLQTRALVPDGSLSRRQHPLFFQLYFASNQSCTLTIAGRQGALSCCHSPRQRGQLCPDPQPELVHHPRLVHVHVSSPLPQSPSGFSTTRSDTGVPRGTPRPLLQRDRQPPHPSFRRQLRHRRHNLLPLIATQPLQSPAFIATKSVRHHHFDRPAPLKPQVVDR